jgi:hypothetical protein
MGNLIPSSFVAGVSHHIGIHSGYRRTPPEKLSGPDRFKNIDLPAEPLA